MDEIDEFKPVELITDRGDISLYHGYWTSNRDILIMNKSRNTKLINKINLYVSELVIQDKNLIQMKRSNTLKENSRIKRENKLKEE